VIRVRCDSCGVSIQPVLVDMPRPEGGAVREFSCPSCGAAYPVAVITARGLEITELLKTERRPVEMQALLDEMKGEVKRVS